MLNDEFSYTQHEKLIFLMARKRAQEWFKPQDLMQAVDPKFFVGYEASARLSELAKQYPEMIESRRDGKYMARRVMYENIGVWWPLLSTTMQGLFISQGVYPTVQTKLL